jgi:2-succinyl-5-enolpyruvyl-6-hydroxy-3-cyclohexene-1-carboxylate synthase
VIPKHAFVYLGNSQPIREWNQFAVVEDRGFAFGENRGANGIDGQLSTFLGQAADGRENWAIVGDLTALYDLQAPWALRHAATPVRIVIVNNAGGRIFERMFPNARFQNRHALSFEAFAALWGCEYRRVSGPDEWSELADASPATMIEVRPDEEQTRAFWQALRNGGVS